MGTAACEVELLKQQAAATFPTAQQCHLSVTNKFYCLITEFCGRERLFCGRCIKTDLKRMFSDVLEM